MFSVGFVRRSSVAYEIHDAVCTEKEEEEEEEAGRAKEAEMRSCTAILKVKVIEEKKIEIKPDKQLRLCGLWGKNQCPEGDLMGHAGGEAFPNQAFPIPEG